MSVLAPSVHLSSRIVRLYCGLGLYGVGIGLQVESTLGNDPWDVFHQGLAVRTGWSIGTWIILVGALVMICWIPLRQRPGIGTISNILFLGLFADATIWLAPTPSHLLPRSLFLVIAIVSVAAATALYISAGLGPGPRDGLMMGLRRVGLSIRLARTLIEVTVLAVGWLLGGTVGVGTLAFALSIGPLTQWFMRILPSAE